MSLSAAELRLLLGCALDAARGAGELIARSRPQRVERKRGGHTRASQVVTEVDRRSQRLILQALAPTQERFTLGLLSEEQPDDRSRRHAEYFWCIDPLDGTLPFIEASPGYAVSIALVARDATPYIGVIFDPVEGTLYHAVRGMGVFRDGVPWTSAARPQGPALSLFTDRSFTERPEHEAVLVRLRQVARELGLAGLVLGPTGGAVMNACRVLAHPPACYFKWPKPQPGGGSLWDYAATACLFHEAGAVATDMQGDPLDLNRADSTFMNHRGILFASDEGLARRLRALAK